MLLQTACDSPTIAVILSTYNGGRYLRDQIDSILVQDIPNLQLFVRDDGSTDGTPSLLATYERAGLAHVFYGHNIGAAASYFECLRLADQADYYAYSDQDDLWLTDKLSRAVNMIEQSSATGPLLYCSELNYCDADLAFDSASHLNLHGVSFGTQLYETVCSGNTMVFNSELRDQILCHDTTGAFLHDWWTSLIACSFGTVIWDTESRIAYRRLPESVSPSGMHTFALQFYRIRKILLGGQVKQIQSQLDSLYTSYASIMNESDEQLLNRAVHGSRLARALTPTRLRQKVIDEFLLRATMLFGLI